MGGEFTEEFEPLFDYHRVQHPFGIVSLDDELSDSDSDLTPKRTGKVVVDKAKENGKNIHVVDGDEEDEDDWMPPPPKVVNDSRKYEEDPTLKELRLKKQELTSYAKSAEEVLRSVEESVKRDFDIAQAAKSVAHQPSKLNSERAKIIISIQDKDELKQFRVYKDEKFERLFVMYAEKTKLDMQNLVFCFDGDKINPSATPDGLGMEDEDIVEVHIKSR